MTFLDPEAIPADDRGFLLGDGLFETVRLYRGHPFRLETHLARMEAGAGRLGIPVPGDLRARVAGAVDAWGSSDGALRITLTRGRGAGLAPSPGRDPQIAVRITEWRPDPRWWTEGLRAHPAGAVTAGALTAGLKSLGYLERIHALGVARARGGDEAILRNERGELVEGSASNLLAVDGERVVAPGLREGALSGITRQIVLEVLEERGLRVEERGVPPELFGRASEVLLTSSLREVVPVVRMDGKAVGPGRPGPVFRAALAGLRRRVAFELDLEPGEVGA